MDLETFAPNVDIQAEMDAAPEQAEAPSEQPAEKPVESAAPEQTDTPAPEHEVKTVPIAALAEARRQAKELRQKQEEAERNHAAQIAELNAKLERLVNPPPPEPSFDENPAENLRQRQERLEAEQRAWKEEQQKRAQETERETQQRQVLNFVNTEVEKAETAFVAKQPDYMEAVNYLKSVSEKNLRASGITDPAMIQKITYEQSLNMAANALQQGLNPAEVAYTFAKNYGYSHKVDATKQVKAMAEAQSRTQNMGNGKPETEFSVAALAQMNDEELSEAIADNKIWRKIVSQG